MTNKEVLSGVYADMVESGRWWSVGEVVKTYSLTISQRDYFRQVVSGNQTGHNTSIKKVGNIYYYKLTKVGAKDFVACALGFKPTTSSTFLVKHG